MAPEPRAAHKKHVLIVEINERAFPDTTQCHLGANIPGHERHEPGQGLPQPLPARRQVIHRLAARVHQHQRHRQRRHGHRFEQGIVPLQHQRHTLKGIKENGIFSVNVPSTSLVKETDYCGIVATHHEPESYGNQDDSLFNILQVANNLMRKVGISISSDRDVSIVSLPSTAKLGLEPLFIATLELDIEAITRYIPRFLGSVLASLPDQEFLEGLDDIGMTLKHMDGIVGWERRAAAAQPWRYDDIIILSQGGGDAAPERVDSETIIILLLLHNFVKKPLDRIMNNMSRVEMGDLNVRIPYRGRDEIGRLIQSFNSMVDKLAVAKTELEQLRTRFKDDTMNMPQEPPRKSPKAKRKKAK